MFSKNVIERCLVLVLHKGRSYRLRIKSGGPETISNAEHHQAQILPSGCVPSIREIQRQFIRQYDISIKTFWLRRACQNFFFVAIDQRWYIGNTRATSQNRPPDGVLKVYVARHLWPGPYQCHVAANDIPELRNLVQFIAAENSPDMRNAWIASARHLHAGVVFAHRPQLQ
jgi:hypothetical protein